MITVFAPADGEALKRYLVGKHRCVFEVVDPDNRTRVKECGEVATHYASRKERGLCDLHAKYAMMTGAKEATYR